MEDKAQETVVEDSVGVGKGESSRKKVLLSFVGMRDPNSDNNKSKSCTVQTPPQTKPMGSSLYGLADDAEERRMNQSVSLSV